MLTEFLIITSLNYIGVVVTKILHLPIPGTIIGLILLFIFLATKQLKLERIEKVSNFLLENMTILFLPPAINLIAAGSFLEGQILKIIFLMVATTFFKMGITGKVVQFLIEKKEERDERNHRG